MALADTRVDEALLRWEAQIFSITGTDAGAAAMDDIRRAVERRVHLIDDKPPEERERALRDLIMAAARDAALWPLIQRARQGDREARNKLLTAIQPALRVRIRARMFPRDDDRVEDALQDSLMVIDRLLDSYSRDGQAFLTWARAIAGNCAVWGRPRHIGREVPVDEGEQDNIADAGRERDISLPPSRCFAEALQLVMQHPPNRALAFLFIQYLGWKPAQLAELWAGRTLRELLDRFEKELFERFPVLRRTAGLLRELRATLDEGAGDSRFEGEAAGRLSRWAADSRRALEWQILQQAKHFLRLASELKARPHEKLAFLHCRPLRRTVEAVVARATWLLDNLLEAFRSEFPLLADLTREQTEWATDPLAREIGKLKPVPALSHYGGADLPGDVARWREKVQRLLVGPEHDQHVLAFSYLCGCMPGVTARMAGGAHDIR